MANIDEYYPYDFYQNDQDFYYDDILDCSYDNRYIKNKSNKKYCNMKKTQKSEREQEINYIEAPNASKTFRTYFRPICTCDLKQKNNRNKSYSSNKLSKSYYFTKICPYCGGENKHSYQTQSINRSQNFSLNNMSDDINSHHSFNALDMLNKTISPNNNQLIYIMPKNKIQLLFRTCTCKKKRMALSQEKVNKNISGNKVNKLSKIVQTETVSDSTQINTFPNISSDFKRCKICNGIYTNMNPKAINDNMNANNKKNIISNTIKIDTNPSNVKVNDNNENNLNGSNNEQKDIINNNDMVPSENINLNGQNNDLDKINENQGENINNQIQLNNLDQKHDEENDNNKEHKLNENIDINQLNEEKNINDNKEGINSEENNNINQDLLKENENNNNPQDINNNEKSDEKRQNEINQNDLEQNEMINYYMNKIDEVNYQENEEENNEENNEENEENKIINTNQNNIINNSGNEQEGEEIKNENEEKDEHNQNKDMIKSQNNEENNDNDNVNLNINEESEEQQNGEYKFKYVQLERDDVPENKTDQNIDYNINEEFLANNKINEEEQNLENDVKEKNKLNYIENKDNDKIEINNNEGLDNNNEVEQNGEKKKDNINLEKPQNDKNDNNNLNINLKKEQNKENEIENAQNENNLNLINEQNKENEIENEDIQNAQNEEKEKANIQNDEENNLLNKDNEEIEENINNKENTDKKISQNDENDEYNNKEENKFTESPKKDNIDINLNKKLKEEKMQYSNRYENENGEENEEEIDVNKKHDKNLIPENINGIKLYSEVKDSNNTDNEKEEEHIIYEFNNNLNKNSNKKKKKGQSDEYKYESQPLSGSEKKKNSKSKNKIDYSPSNSKSKYKFPISGELIFNPKKSKRRSYHPLFTKYEMLEFNNAKRFSAIPPSNDSVFKMAVEIFPSKYGFVMPYRSQLRQSNYSVYSSRSIDKSNRKRTVSEKRKRTDIRSNDGTSIKEFDFNAKSELFILKRYGKQNYFTYKSKIRSDNPFVGISHYSKNKKQRKNLIAKAVKKEGNQFNEIISIEDNIIKKRDIDENELNQLIITLTKFIYDDNEKNLDNKESYEFKINKASNIIKFMKDENQKKIMEELKNNAKDDYSIEIFEILKTKIDDYKEKLGKYYKIEENGKNGERESKRSSSIKKSFKKFIKVTK